MHAIRLIVIAPMEHKYHFCYIFNIHITILCLINKTETKKGFPSIHVQKSVRYLNISNKRDMLCNLTFDFGLNS